MIRTLHIERPYEIGGSIISLHLLLSNLDRTSFQPILLVYRPHPFRERFELLDIPVITLHATPVAPVPAAPAGRDIAASLASRSKLAANNYRRLAFYYRLLRHELPVARRIGRILKAENVDLVHTNNSLPNNRAAVLAARRARIPVICHYRMFKPIVPFDCRLARHVAAHLYNSRAVADHYLACGFPAERAHVVHNVVSPDFFQEIADPLAARAELGIAPDDPVVGMVGRLDWWKGHDVFLRAVARLVDRFPGLRILIVGGVDGRSINQAYAAQLSCLAAELNISDLVTFTGHRDDIPAVMSAMDVVVHASTQPEPFGRVIIEALALRKPVVASAAGGVTEIIKDGVHGLLAPPGDVARLSAAIAELLTDPQRSAALARAGYQRVWQHFSIQSQVNAVETIFRQVLSMEPDHLWVEQVVRE